MSRQSSKSNVPHLVSNPQAVAPPPPPTATLPLSSTTVPTPPTSTENTWWDWVKDIIIPILQGIILPVVVALAVFWLNSQQNKANLQLADQQRVANMQIASNQAKDAVVSTYVDRMSDLLMNHNLQRQTPYPGNVPIALARARTLTALQQLGNDGERKAYILRLLYESNAIVTPQTSVTLDQADFSWLKWESFPLLCLNMTDAYLQHADFRNANLSGSDFYGAKLAGANFSGAVLDHTDFSGSDITQAQITSSRSHKHLIDAPQVPMVNEGVQIKVVPECQNRFGQNQGVTSP